MKCRYLPLAALSTAVLSISSFVSADLPNTFVEDTPAVAAEVNENFEFLNSRIDALSNYELIELDINCSGLEPNPAALQEALDTRPFGRIRVNVAGACGPVQIRGMHDVSLVGASGASITGTSGDQPALLIDASTGVSISDLRIASAANSTAFGTALTVTFSQAALENLVVTNDGSSDSLLMRVTSQSSVSMTNSSVENDTGSRGLLVSDKSTVSLLGLTELKGTRDALQVLNGAVAQGSASNGQQLVTGLNLDGGLTASDAQLDLLDAEIVSGSDSNVALSISTSRLQVFVGSNGFSVEGETQMFDSLMVAFLNGGDVLLDSGRLDVVNSRFATVNSIGNVNINSNPVRIARSEVSWAGGSVSVDSNTQFSIEEFSSFSSLGFVDRADFTCQPFTTAQQTSGTGDQVLCP
ncbi:MAG: hypothetical protein AAGI11_04020 [Pseudomonadota bacterium]